MSREYERELGRAALYASSLIFWHDKVTSSKIINISRKGFLLDHLSLDPKEEVFECCFFIPQMPLLRELKSNLWPYLRTFNFSAQRVMATAKVTYYLSGEAGIFLENVGCEFVELSSSDVELIEKHHETRRDNLSYLLKSLSNQNTKPVEKEGGLSFLGYEEFLDKGGIVSAQSKALHDFQNLSA